jgi:hypothetical protein
MDRLEIVMLRGSSGGVYPFHAHPVHTRHKNTGAVYVLTNRRTDARGREYHSIICIGQTDELEKTLSRHRNTPWLRKHDGNCVCLYFEKEEDRRVRLETDLIRYYSPRVSLVKTMPITPTQEIGMRPYRSPQRR